MRPFPATSRRPPRTGWTILEALVVLSVIGLLAALILPAVMASRASAREVSCRNNLRQIALALHEHEATRGRLPAGTDGGWSVAVQLLPWLEAGQTAAALAKIDGGPVLGDWAPSGYVDAWRMAAPPAMHCPDDGESIGPWSSDHPNTGVDRDWFAAADGPFQIPRPGGPGRVLSLADVRDGAGTTAAYSEALVRGAGPGRVVREARHAYVNTPAATEYFLTDCLTLPPPAEGAFEASAMRGGEWSWAVRGRCGYIHAAPPGSPACLTAGEMQSGLWPADSGHRGVVNLALLDGAVRPVSTAVDLDVWRAAGTHDGGEVFGADEL